MTTFQEIDLPNALAEYAKQNSADLSDDNCWTLPTGERTGWTSIDDVNWTHQTIPKPTELQCITIYDQWAADNLQAETEQQAIQTVESNAKSQAQNIPNWATWTEAQALSWHDTNIANVLPVASLAEANVVLAKLETENRALVRMVLALRNKVFPDLEGG